MNYYKDGDGAPQSVAFSITAEETNQIEEEYYNATVLDYLYKAACIFGNHVTIGEAIEKLSEKTRFAQEVKENNCKQYAYAKV